MPELEKTYNWEESYDLARDVSEAVDSIVAKHGGEFKGEIKVTVEYIKR